MQFSVRSWTLSWRWSLTSLQRCNRHILQTQLGFVSFKESNRSTGFKSLNIIIRLTDFNDMSIPTQLNMLSYFWSHCCTYTHTHTRTHTHTDTHTHTHTHRHRHRHTHTHTHTQTQTNTHTHIHIYIYKVGDIKALFTITTSRCRRWPYSFTEVALLYPWYVPYKAEC